MGLATTTKTQNFGATIQVKDDKNILAINSPQYYQHQLNKFKENDRVSVYITNEHPKRTVAQNRYYWGVYLPLIAKETGEQDLDRLHTLFKGKFLTTEIAEVLGEKVRITKSTTDLSTTEFSEYIMSIEGLTTVAAPPTDFESLNELTPWRR